MGAQGLARVEVRSGHFKFLADGEEGGKGAPSHPLMPQNPQGEAWRSGANGESGDRASDGSINAGKSWGPVASPSMQGPQVRSKRQGQQWGQEQQRGSSGWRPVKGPALEGRDQRPGAGGVPPPQAHGAQGNGNTPLARAGAPASARPDYGTYPELQGRPQVSSETVLTSGAPPFG